MRRPEAAAPPSRSWHRELFLLALAARLATCALTEWRPVFPAYFELDAAEHHAAASRMASDWSRGLPASPTMSPAKRTYEYALASLYYVFGPSQALARAANAVLASLAVIVLYRLAGAFLPAAAAAFGLFLALWPSYVYVGASNTKASLVFLAVAGAVSLYLGYLRAGGGLRLAGFVLVVYGLALLKVHFVLVFCVGLALGTTLAAALSAFTRRHALALAAVVLAGGLYRPVARAALQRWLPAALQVRAHAEEEFDVLARPVPVELQQWADRPSWTARLQALRDSRHYWSQRHSEKVAGRRIETQILPGYRFDGVGDVLLFLPRAAFHALFMPLPGLYPLDGKPGRWLAAFENAALLALALAALWQLAWRVWPPEALVPLALFLALLSAYAFFEYDLGSATRHKPEYLPFLLMFAFRGVGPGAGREGRRLFSRR